MADKAQRDGLIVLYQKISSSYVEKETFVKLTPCCNCFNYDHKTRECSKPKQTLCSFCSSKEHLHNNCPATFPKCLNCGGKHKTLASASPVRKDLIKTRAKDVRERSRSRSKSRHVSYASTVNNSGQQQSIPNVNVNSQETKELVSKIITSIVFAYYMESQIPGSFQSNVDEMFKLNGLPLVKFPQNIATKEFQNLIKDATGNVSPPENPQENPQSQKEKEKEYFSDDNDMEIQYKNKRVRGHNSPTQSKNKKEKPSATTEESQTNECKAKHNHLFVTPVPERQSRNKSNSSCNNSRSSSTENNYSNAAPRGSKFRNTTPKVHKM